MPPTFIVEKGGGNVKAWALLRTRQKIQKDIVMEFPERPEDAEGWQRMIGELCQALHLGRPVVLSKHLRQLDAFSRTSFLPHEFLEPVPFDKFEIELFSEKEDEKIN